MKAGRDRYELHVLSGRGLDQIECPHPGRDGLARDDLLDGDRGAARIVDLKVEPFLGEVPADDAVHLVHVFEGKVEGLHEQELAGALRKGRAGDKASPRQRGDAPNGGAA